VESGDLTLSAASGAGRAVPEARSSGAIPDAPWRIGDQRRDLDENRVWPYSPHMINASTILIARRRRAIAVWAVVCV
jgi:hypothetical protein